HRGARAAKDDALGILQRRSLVMRLAHGVAMLLLAHAAAVSEPIAVAFVLTDGANVIDFAGPWEVFQHRRFQARRCRRPRRQARDDSPRFLRPVRAPLSGGHARPP